MNNYNDRLKKVHETVVKESDSKAKGSGTVRKPDLQSCPGRFM